MTPDRQALVRRLGFFTMPARAGELWRARYVAGRGQVIVTEHAEHDGAVHVELEVGKGRTAYRVTICSSVPDRAAEALLRAAMDEAHRYPWRVTP